MAAEEWPMDGSKTVMGAPRSFLHQVLCTEDRLGTGLSRQGSLCFGRGFHAVPPASGSTGPESEPIITRFLTRQSC